MNRTTPHFGQSNVKNGMSE